MKLENEKAKTAKLLLTFFSLVCMGIGVLIVLDFFDRVSGVDVRACIAAACWFIASFWWLTVASFIQPYDKPPDAQEGPEEG